MGSMQRVRAGLGWGVIARSWPGVASVLVLSSSLGCGSDDDSSRGAATHDASISDASAGSRSDGGEDAGAVCAFTPCGGDLSGTSWSVTQICSGPEGAFGDVCSDAVVDFSAVTATGGVTFGEDGSVETNLTLAGTLEVILVASCFDGTGPSCDMLSEEAISCSADASENCLCNATVDQSFGGSGTYTASGSTVTITIGGEPEDAEYCVQGDRMVLRNGAGTFAAARQ